MAAIKNCERPCSLPATALRKAKIEGFWKRPMPKRKDIKKILIIGSGPIIIDPELAKRTYIEPLTREYLEEIIAKEKPHALLPTVGGQTALNLAVELSESGVLEKYKVDMIGASLRAIKVAE